jgi:signal transduction histidine kinase
MRLVVRPGLTIKAALILGFGLTLALWVYTGYQFADSVTQLEQQSAGIATRYAAAQDLLSAIRAQVLSSSGLVRDALLDTSLGEPANPPEIAASLDRVHRLLEDYQPVFDSSPEASSLQHIRGEMGRFAESVADVLGKARGDRSAQSARLLMSARLVPSRDALLGSLDRMQAVNRAAFIEYQSNLDATHSVAEQQTWRSLGWALALSFAIAVVATLYAGRLEKRLVSQLGTNERTRRALQHLSTKLIGLQEEERKRIARELHDEVGQALTAIKLELAVVQRGIDAAGGDSTLLQSVHSITDQTLHAVRDLSHLIRPWVLDDLGLTAAVDWYLRVFSKRSGIGCELTQHHMAARFEPDVEVAAYRMIQEALTNVARHAQATTCSVALAYHAGTISIVIEDDGIGFDEHAVDVAADRSRLGLLGMRERAAHFGGAVVVARVSPHGTRVTIQLPARRQPHTPDDWSPSPGTLPTLEHG